MRAECPESHRSRVGTSAECGDCPMTQRHPLRELPARLDLSVPGNLPAQLTAEAAIRPAHQPGLTPEMREKAAQIIEVALTRAEAVLTRHVEWPSRADLDKVLMWLVHANAREPGGVNGMPGKLIWEATPRMLLTSVLNQSGKSTGLTLMARMAGSRFGRQSNITAPGFAAMISQYNEPVMIDDVGNLFGRGEGHRMLQQHILNGYTPDVITFDARKGGTARNLFGVVAYAGRDELITANMTGSLTDLLSRSIIIRMSRPRRFYPDIDQAARQWASTVHNMMLQWCYVMSDDLQQAAWDLSQEAAAAGELAQSDVDNGILRKAQINRPLLACARVIGGDWPDRMMDAVSAGSELDEILATAQGMPELTGMPAQITFTDE